MSKIKIFRFCDDLDGWEEFTEVKISSPSNSIEEGCEARFVRISKKVGIKIFQSKEEARESAKKQLAAYKKGFAPKVIDDTGSVEKFAIVYGTDMTVGWGYETQVARLMNAKEEYRYDSKGGEAIFRNALKKAGIPHRDTHVGNVGYIGKKLVRIDFGKAST